MTRKIAVYAHRGASAYVLENTLEAFEKAMALGADGIELDIQRSSDQQLFVFHDNDLFRLTGIRRMITECSGEEMQTFRLRKGKLCKLVSHKIPLFEEVLRWACEQKIMLNIELKESLVDHLEPLVALLKRYPLVPGSHISSFHLQALIDIKKQLPQIETAFLVTKKFNWLALQDMPYIDAVHAHKKYYARRFLKAAEAAKKPVRFYAIEGHELFLLRPHPVVAGWITDYPDKVAKIEAIRQRYIGK